MSNGLLKRLRMWLLAEDEAANAVFGGKPTQTISGTVGRALKAGASWAGVARFLIEDVMRFGRGHCLRQAELEANQIVG